MRTSMTIGAHDGLKMSRDQALLAASGYGTFQKGVLVKLDDVEDITQSRYENLTFREKLFLFLECPRATRAGYWYGLFNIVITVLATCVLVWQSEPFHYIQHDLTYLDYITFGAIAFYTLDYIARFLSAPNPIWHAMTNTYMIVDFLATVPYYIELILMLIGVTESGGVGLATLRALRILRVFRVFHLVRFSSLAEMMMGTFSKCWDGLTLLGLVFFLILVIFSTLIFYAEQTVQTFDETRMLWIRPDGSVSPFQSILAAMWWCGVTMTTVGYGDAYPISGLGKLVAAVTAVSSILVLALPITLFSSAFAELYREKRMGKECDCPGEDDPRITQIRLKYELQLQEATRSVAELTASVQALLEVVNSTKGGSNMHTSNNSVRIA